MPPSATPLPIEHALPELKAVLRSHSNVVLQAPPGAGKSTRVPLALLDEPWLKNRNVVMLEPRRLAARSVATRMAATLSEAVGRTVGYRTRLDTKVGAHTRIEVVTEGILTRMLQRDAALEECALLIFDEFHERSLQADLGLALSLDTQSNLREDLKILVMSATLDGAAVAKLLNEAPIVTSMGRAFPVSTHYRNPNAVGKKIWNDTDIARDAANAVLRALEQELGDILVFLPGQGEIRRVQRFLEEQLLSKEVSIRPLYGELAFAEQDLAIRPDQNGLRKIVLATNIAETSLTIEGIRVVVDSGLERRARFDPASGMSRLETQRISRASADQRRGRAGRTQAGVCHRLWLESEQDSLAAHTAPEIVDADLAPVALELASWGVTEPNRLRWLTPPPAASYAQAQDLLQWLGALDADKKITAHGRDMANLGTHPRLAHLLLRAKQNGFARFGAELAALLSERDVFRSTSLTAGRSNPGAANHSTADIRLRVDALRGAAAPDIALDANAKQRVLRSADLFLRQLGAARDVANADTDADAVIGRLLAFAYPDRIARARGEGGRYLLVNGRGASFAGPQSLSQAEFLAIAELDGGERDARIRLAAPVQLEALMRDFSELVQTRIRIEWDAREQAVIAQRERTLGALLLDAQRLEKPDAEQVTAAMLQGVRELGLDALPWTDAARNLLARMQFAQAHDPRATQPWPLLDDESLLAQLDTWLAPWLNGITRCTQLAQLDLHEILWSLLDWNQQQRLNDLAPTHLQVPSGSRIPIDYSGATPTLSVRLQEVFGMTETPRVGSIPVRMELLSPARRPVQVTQDLASFWARGYHEVKKDLKGRYPKHYWPDDPLQAAATARAKPRGK